MLRIQAVFLDRDGTIGGSDRVIYPKEFTLFPGVADSIKQLKKAGILIYSFTNQPGISKGEVSFISFEEELTVFGFDKIYLCPHRSTDGCTCRKPSPEMLLTAAKENNLNLQQCVVIGDRWTDLMAADEVGCKKILVKTGSGMDAYNKYINGEFFGRWKDVTPDFIAEDVNEAVNWLLA
ncbi:HAD-IIIA family hydrolase [Sporosarcina thermotolerans]|uniref:D,D-heptose 1,7-bisphosphate phosphatase n=1 Tax=Sporosarcina thermotolerans TaxID=633404 RepID=A0AAW9AG58_9BACL|nr:HAD-IIIA family hydrolase [Sporosarcina thermotolerans]MDW0118633.1 HAD-IIIA family hydrolase [Sporosarcina thermotolerans]WHT49890.1 HAD-IIIA family hydrolase [Sporosarcina thermotolerans]